MEAIERYFNERNIANEKLINDLFFSKTGKTWDDLFDVMPDLIDNDSENSRLFLIKVSMESALYDDNLTTLEKQQLLIDLTNAI